MLASNQKETVEINTEENEINMSEKHLVEACEEWGCALEPKEEEDGI